MMQRNRHSNSHKRSRVLLISLAATLFKRENWARPNKSAGTKAPRSSSNMRWRCRSSCPAWALGPFFFFAAPHSGYCTITIPAYAENRVYPYPYETVGVPKEDPLYMAVYFGQDAEGEKRKRRLVFPVADDHPQDVTFTEWLNQGSQLEIKLHTDGLDMNGNGNFKFNLGIHGDYIGEFKKTKDGRTRGDTVSIWKNDWLGPRLNYGVLTIDGPFYKSWPPRRLQKIVGEDPSLTAVLTRFARKAFRRPLRPGELDSVLKYARAIQDQRGDVEAIKEGIVAILASPGFLYHNAPMEAGKDYYVASKLSYLLWSTLPDQELMTLASSNALTSSEELQSQAMRMLEDPKIASFYKYIANAWFELDKINFMAPDITYKPYRFWHRKNLGEDMVAEAEKFFSHVIENNLPIHEVVAADYSFINQDLATIYEVPDIKGSHLRKHVFTDGRRGGVLGMGALLTLTADSLSTSPIHRGMWVQKNLLGTIPPPPPGDVNVVEPDLTSATTIRETLEKHRSQKACRNCHLKIDPYGFALEVFDPTGQVRTHYTRMSPGKKFINGFQGKEVSVHSEFSNGASYTNMQEYRTLLLEHKDKIARSFVIKLLTYANGINPGALADRELDAIVETSRKADYKIVDTIIAAVRSPLFL